MSEQPSDRPVFAWATALLVITNLLVYAYMAARSGSLAPDSEWLSIGWKQDGAVAAGHAWRLVTGVFLHAHLLHVLVNMGLIWLIGSQFEETCSPAGMWVVFFVSGVTGAALGDLLSDHTSVGASGAGMGLIGAGLGLGLVHRGREGIDPALARRMLGLLVTVLAVSPFLPNVDHYGHAGGALTGLLLSPFVALRSARPPWRANLERLAAVLAVVVVVASASLAARGLRPLTYQRNYAMPTLGLALRVPEQWTTLDSDAASVTVGLPGVPAMITVTRRRLPWPLPEWQQAEWIRRGLGRVSVLRGPEPLTMPDGRRVWHVVSQRGGQVIEEYLWFGEAEVVRLIGQVGGDRWSTYYAPIFAAAARSLSFTNPSR